ncbi:flagellar basal body-associated protein FliL [Nocardioides marmoriginsengisoli]|uniref:Flagellar protein FliL n=1 Tax=Nocardioides marmoriginsengisoli TaxID=661483 RepID=A0A3N0CGT5_9ACTN|nr:flagellar basal body-associated FliL family protein [Nocardioides marmoriginsengisoli]RNL62645.1 flagellar basal body-associated protein FliL [Nocardioides marmoriginsengisoli]
MTVTAMPQTPADEAVDAPVRKSRKKLVTLLVGALLLGGGGYYLFLMPAKSGPPVPGEVVTLEPIQVNLAAEHYLRIGIALQLVKGVKEADGSKALDATIEIFSGLPMAEVNDPKHRAALKKELVKELEERYEKEVMGVYFTELVTQ